MSSLFFKIAWVFTLNYKGLTMLKARQNYSQNMYKKGGKIQLNRHVPALRKPWMPINNRFPLPTSGKFENDCAGG